MRRHRDDRCRPPRRRPPWAARVRGELRLYYGAHLHRRLFLWFGATLFVHAALLALVWRVLGRTWLASPFRPLVLFVLPALVLWTASGKIARRIARPLYGLVRVAQDIGGGNLRARAALERGGIGEIAALSRALNDMAARIERQIADQRELLAGVSHELRTPLGRLRVLLEILRDRGADASSVAEAEREVLELDALVGALLASARLDFQTLDPRPLDPADAAVRALARAGLAANLLHAVDPPVPSVTADATLLARALANLIDNAQKYGGGLRGLEIAHDTDCVRFVVCDHGPGFPPGWQLRSPRPQAVGETETSPRAEGSLGLGLSLVDRIARAHAGRLRAENGPSGGARVTLQLPRRGKPTNPQ